MCEKGEGGVYGGRWKKGEEASFGGRGGRGLTAVTAQATHFCTQRLQRAARLLKMLLVSAAALLYLRRARLSGDMSHELGPEIRGDCQLHARGKAFGRYRGRGGGGGRGEEEEVVVGEERRRLPHSYDEERRVERGGVERRGGSADALFDGRYKEIFSYTHLRSLISSGTRSRRAWISAEAASNLPRERRCEKAREGERRRGQGERR